MFAFQGSFQARLATDPDPTGSSPTDPAGTYGRRGMGWTFAYKETPFDRVIRLSNPVDLRSALVDEWIDTTIRGVWVERDPPPKGYPSPMLLLEPTNLEGKGISLGAAKFDTASGGGVVTREAIVDFSFNVDGKALTAEAATAPLMDGLDDPKRVSDWFAREYKSLKAKRMATAQIDPLRKRYLEDSNNIEILARFFMFSIPARTFALKNVSIGIKSGVLAEMSSPTDYSWRIENLNFLRFDGDTLTGRCGGVLWAEHV
jgi:hypothetical protein